MTLNCPVIIANITTTAFCFYETQQNQIYSILTYGAETMVILTRVQKLLSVHNPFFTVIDLWPFLFCNVSQPFLFLQSVSNLPLDHLLSSPIVSVYTPCCCLGKVCCAALPDPLSEIAYCTFSKQTETHSLMTNLFHTSTNENVSK